MKFEQPIICMFCVQPLTQVLKFNRPKDLRNAEREVMQQHKFKCTLWNDLAYDLRNVQ
jgi:hypothetical protein